MNGSETARARGRGRARGMVRVVVRGVIVVAKGEVAILLLRLLAL
jgi:hypothetical protein